MNLLDSLGIHFIQSPDELAQALASHHTPSTVLLSVVIAIVTSACAFEMTARLEHNHAMVLWLPLVAILQGAGIWSMHFIGALAFQVDCAVSFDSWRTAWSVLPSIVACGGALQLESRQRHSHRVLVVSSAVMASGICLMHYIGMHAVQFDGVLRYDRVWFVLSLTCVWAFAYAALRVRRHLRRQVWIRPVMASVVSGVAMGGAVAGMHYISMAGVHVLYVGTGGLVNDPLLTGQDTMAVAVAAVTLLLTVLGLSFTVGVSRLDSMRRRVDLVLANSGQGFATFNRQGVVDRCNPALARMMGCELEQVLGRPVQSLFPEEMVSRLRGRYKLQTHLARADGSLLACVVHGDDALDADRTALYTFAWIEDVAEREAADLALRQAHAAAQSAEEQVRTLLDNSDQGFLVITAALQIEGKFSVACERILGPGIAGSNLTERLIPPGFFDDDLAREQLQRNLLRVFQSADHPVRQAAYLELLPTELCLNGQTYRLQYKWLASQRLMLILSDITETVALQDRIHRERKRVEYFINAMENRAELLKTIGSWQAFVDHTLPRLLDELPTPPSLAADVRRHVHTFKGLFAQDSFPGMPGALHALETELERLPATPEHWPESIRSALSNAALEACMRQDLGLLSEQLGLDLSTAERTVEVPLRALRETGETLDQLVRSGACPAETLAPMQTALRRLSMQPLHRLLEPHFTAAQSLAPQLGKLLAPIRHEGDHVFVDEARMAPLVDALVHVFRNCVDHGIEPPEQRTDIGKDPQARIRCHIAVEGPHVKLMIGDDGQGIDPERIRTAALRRQVTTEEQARQMSRDELLNMIFADQLTTRESVGSISGRGIGLAAVRRAAQTLGGDVRVDSSPGEGTRFHFAIPLVHPEYIRRDRSTQLEEQPHAA